MPDDNRLEDVAWLRLIGDNGRRYTLDEVVTELGIEDDEELQAMLDAAVNAP